MKLQSIFHSNFVPEMKREVKMSLALADWFGTSESSFVNAKCNQINEIIEFGFISQPSQSVKNISLNHPPTSNFPFPHLF